MIDSHISGVSLQVNETVGDMCKIKSQLHAIPIFIRISKPVLVKIQSVFVLLRLFSLELLITPFHFNRLTCFGVLPHGLRAVVQPFLKQFFQITGVLNSMDLMDAPEVFNHLAGVAFSF